MKQNLNNKKISLRSPAQNRAIHKLFDLWAGELNGQNKSMFEVLKDHIEIPWTKYSVYQYIWLPLEKEHSDLRSTYEKMSEALENYIEVEKLPTIEDIFAVSLKKGLSIYYGLVANALNEAGADMRTYLPMGVDIWWNKDTVKNYLWRPVQILKTGNKSTTQLLTTEIDPIYDTVNRHLGKHINTVMFPSVEEIIIRMNYEKEKK